MISEILNQIFKGALLILFGTLVGKGLEFFSRILIGRILGPADFGVFNMGYTVVTIGSSLSLLGLSQGVAHFIPSYNTDNNETTKKNISDLILFSFLIVLTSSLIISSILYFFSDFIAYHFFHNLILSSFLKIFIWSIPLISLLQLSSGTFRGFKKPGYKIISEDIAKGTIFLFLLVVGLFFFRLTLSYLAYIYIICCFLACFLGIYLLYKFFHLKFNINYNFLLIKQLFTYSLPLAFSIILVRFQSQIPVIFLSYFSAAKKVGLYSAAILISQVLNLGLFSLNFMLMPIFSELFSLHKFSELKKTYDFLTRMLIFIFFPISLLLIVYSSTILRVLFGELYVYASIALKILLIGFIFNIYCGPVGLLTLAIGESKRYFIYDLIGFFSISLIGLFIIPHYDLVGAALSVTFSLIIWNSIALFYIYKNFRIHSFKKENLLFISISTFLFFLIFLSVNVFFSKFFIIKIALCISIYMVFNIFLVTKFLERDEIGGFIISKLKQRIGRYNV